jgi:cation-transporting ATPase E
MSDQPIPGLTSADVAERVRRGQVNRTPRSDWADYGRIVARNLFTLFNAMVAPAAVALFLLQEYRGAVAVSGMAVTNTVIALVQEIRAKWYLDKLALLVETRVRVRREGQSQEIPASAVVRDDVVLLAAGDAIVADGPVVESRFLEVDEALLTGESDPVRRHDGDRLLSGSFCVTGEGAYRAEKVGAAAFANATSSEARHYRFVSSPLTRVINRIVEVLSVTAVGLCALYLVLWWLGRFEDTGELVKAIAATITSMVPQGLVLTATISFTLGAVLMSRRGAVVQRLNAVETMAAIDVVCTDKTGTLTTNALRLDQIRVVTRDLDDAAVRQRLQWFASATLDRQNKNVQALQAALGKAEVKLLDQLPFKSQNRYSAVRVDVGQEDRVLVMGASEALRPFLDGDSWEAAWRELLGTGLRLLLFADSTQRQPFGETLDGYRLRPLALVALSDDLRPEAAGVLKALAEQGIAFKVVSGDNPDTVRATIGKLPLADDKVYSGADLASAPDAAEIIRTGSVFGRVAPQQKVLIVETLQKQGRCVAMIGDGVNDVLPIKRADLGIAMGAGSQASKTVSGLVLETNNFDLLPETLEEGRTIVRNLRRAGKLFLVKNVYSFMLILAWGFKLLGFFPYEPQQVTLLNWLVIGFPALLIAFSRERSRGPARRDYLREVGGFALRSGVIIAAGALVMMRLATWMWPDDETEQQTLLLSVLILLGITVLLRALDDGEENLRSDTWFRLLALLSVPAYLLAMYVPPSRYFFALAPLTLSQWGMVLAVVLPTYGACLWSDRWKR